MPSLKEPAVTSMVAVAVSARTASCRPREEAMALTASSMRGCPSSGGPGTGGDEGGVMPQVTRAGLREGAGGAGGGEHAGSGQGGDCCSDTTHERSSPTWLEQNSDERSYT
jgi:hypothetical protein